jgi:hypothetical protein
MALSDYLSGDEWDACFYASFGQHSDSNLGDSMRKTIDALRSIGYEFEGLDENGQKKCQVGNGVNAHKVCMFVGNPYCVDPLELLTNGRKFLKEHFPSLVDESDCEWERQISDAKNKRI